MPDIVEAIVHLFNKYRYVWIIQLSFIQIHIFYINFDKGQG